MSMKEDERMSDLTRKLRSRKGEAITRVELLMEEAADALEAQEARIAKMEKALRPFADYSWSLRGRRDSEHELGWLGKDEAGNLAEVNITVGKFRSAKKALEL